MNKRIKNPLFNRRGGFLVHAIIYVAYCAYLLMAATENYESCVRGSLQRSNTTYNCSSGYPQTSLQRFFPIGLVVLGIHFTWPLLYRRLHGISDDTKPNSPYSLHHLAQDLHIGFFFGTNVIAWFIALSSPNTSSITYPYPFNIVALACATIFWCGLLWVHSRVVIALDKNAVRRIGERVQV